LLRIHAAILVEDAGFEAIEAGDADEAVAILASRPDIRIVFTDINMPGSMDGLGLAFAIRDRWPPIDLILTSGQATIANEDIPERGLFFAKPYDAREIVRAMQNFVRQ